MLKKTIEAIALIAYGICKVKSAEKDIRYARLDDSSDKSGVAGKKNIYDSFGAEFIRHQKLSMDGPKHGVELTEPEKQILLGPDFIVRANKLLAKVGGRARTIRRTRKLKRTRRTRNY